MCIHVCTCVHACTRAHALPQTLPHSPGSLFLDWKMLELEMTSSQAFSPTLHLTESSQASLGAHLLCPVLAQPPRLSAGFSHKTSHFLGYLLLLSSSCRFPPLPTSSCLALHLLSYLQEVPGEPGPG